MNKVTGCALIALQLFLAAAASADDETQSKQEIHFKPLKTAQERFLAADWTPTDQPLRMYKQTYFLFCSHSQQPNDAPTSPNPQNQVPYTYPLDRNEMKFQVSVKGHMLGESRNTVWFGYTQLSFWQIYDTGHSGPFRESNHEAEIIYSNRQENLPIGSGFNAGFFNSGIEHLSNGQALPRSRSWNRLYVQAGVERNIGDDAKLALIPRVWKRLGGGSKDDDNPDITHFYGHGDIEARYYSGQKILSVIARIHSLQMDMTMPVTSFLGFQIHNTNLHAQFTDGYGESLIDYNQRHRTFGIGFSLPFE